MADPGCGSRTRRQPTSPKRPRLGFRRSATTLYPSHSCCVVFFRTTMFIVPPCINYEILTNLHKSLQIMKHKQIFTNYETTTNLYKVNYFVEICRVLKSFLKIKGQKSSTNLYKLLNTYKSLHIPTSTEKTNLYKSLQYIKSL